MKHFYIIASLMLVSTISFAQKNNLNTYSHAVANSKKNSLIKNPGTVNDAWLNNAQELIKESEYNFKEAAGSNSFHVANRAQHIGFTITPTGYKSFPLKFSEKASNASMWEQHLMFSGIQKGNTHYYYTKGKFTCSVDKSSLNYNYPGFTIEYKNTDKGLRQNFIVSNKPAGNENLEVLLNIQGSLSASAITNGLQFNDKAGNAKLFYQDLHVWDAYHNIIKASMELRDENTLAIVVNDQNAIYPLTIDPINNTPEWTSSADGILPSLVGQLAVDAAYGFSVAGLGDVNGDGYDDVAVGAPAMVDIISGTGSLAAVGAVFIYYGSPSGLPNTASAVLQPTTAVAGALFGYSIAGGDINNDGKNDIIIGAPLDAVKISIGGGNTASGTVGKVYAYSGAKLNTATTTPLLTLNLSGNGILENGVNLSVNALFGFSVAVTEDMNNDGKKDIIVGSPTYAGIKTGLFGNSLLDVQSGGAFVFLSNASASPTLVKLEPMKTSILGLGLLSSNINGLLFGYSVDGLGDYNGDGKPDIAASAPAGVDLSSLGAILNGKLLQGSVSVYYGTGAGVNVNPGATLTAVSGGLLSNLTGSISNVANLFGISVKAVKNAAGTKNGNVLVGAPLGGAIMNVLSLQLKTGTVSVFKKKVSSPSGYVAPDQVLSSPRNTNNILQLIQANLLFGYSIDNILDVNCDGIGDIIVGEPASSGVQLLNANVAGGAAYIYFGKVDGTYQTSPSWTLTATEDAFLGINGTSLIGFSVAGAGHVRGGALGNKILVGSPSRTLDFGAGLLNLGATVGTIFSLATGDNGVGKAFLFDSHSCVILPVTLTKLMGSYANGVSHLTWKTTQEINSSVFEIERSSNGTEFSFIGTVKAAGNSNLNVDYKFDDIKAKQGLNYYRLKMIDKDGRYVYSNTVVLNVNIKGTSITSVYPSPFIDKVNIAIATEISGEVNIRLFDNTGKLLLNQKSIMSKGSNNIVLDKLSSLSTGSYIIQVQAGETILTQKLIKQ